MTEPGLPAACVICVVADFQPTRNHLLRRGEPTERYVVVVKSPSDDTEIVGPFDGVQVRNWGYSRPTDDG